MKKLILFLLLTVAGYGQVSTGTETYFDYGIQVAPASLQVPTTVNWIGTVGTDGTQGRVLPQNITIPQIPLNYSVLTPTIGAHLIGIDNKLASIPANYSKIVYVNATNPNSATIFDLNNPPITNDNALKIDTANLYIGTDASTWVYNGSVYVTKTITSATSNFYLFGTTTDAGNNKTAAIVRNGNIQATSFIKSGATTTDALLAGGSTLANPVSGTGTSGQVSFWNGTRTQSGDNSLFWDNTNKRLGIGTTTPVGKLDLFTGTSGITSNPGNTNIAFGSISFGNGSAITAAPVIVGRSDDSSGLGFQSGTNDTNASPDMVFNVRRNNNTDFTTLTTNAFKFTRFSTDLMTILRNGNVGINVTPTATATDKLQVNGNITANAGTTASHVVVKSQLDLKADLASPILTGDPKAPTATAGTNTTQIATTAFVTGAIATAVVTARPYKVYTALLTQIGTSAPTAIVLENTTGGTISYSYIAVGRYQLSISGVSFPTNKCTVIAEVNSGYLQGGYGLRTPNFGASTLDIYSYSNLNASTLSDTILNLSTIEIRVYP